MTDHLYEYAVKHGVKVDNARERDTFKLLWKHYFPTVPMDFVAVMEEICAYGAKKHQEKDIFEKAKVGDFSRHSRTLPIEIHRHACDHFGDYLDGKLHDHFGTLRHQLGAAAVNPMMEYILAQVKDK